MCQAPTMTCNILPSSFEWPSICVMRDSGSGGGAKLSQASEVERLLLQGDMLWVFHAILQNCLINTKNQVVKEQAQGMMLKFMQILRAVKYHRLWSSWTLMVFSLLNNKKNMYKRAKKPPKPSENSSTVLLQWHKKTKPVGGRGFIHYKSYCCKKDCLNNKKTQITWRRILDAEAGEGTDKLS